VVHEDTRSSRHSELAGFLMSRRTRLLPESCGLPQLPRRRRTPGLRREEVSALAGISTAYYTWIEQGRRFDVSIEVLDAIAGALQLNAVEASHLFTLAGKATPPPPLPVDGVATWHGAIFPFVRIFEQGPAFVLTSCLDVSEANGLARESLALEAGRNYAEAFFGSEGDVTYRNAETLAGALVSLLRRSHATDVDNAHINGIVARLRERSPAFKLLWDGHVVDRAPQFEVEIERPPGGHASFYGVIVSDPIAARGFAVFMNRLPEQPLISETTGAQ
jgi:transcriptional regulator with XRE-family HTH domain